MAYLALTIGISVAALTVALLVYFGLMTSRHHYTSTLSCPKCQRSFDYDWFPFMSFSAARLGMSRYMRCPLCHEWATFNIWDSRKPASQQSRPE